MPRILLHIGAHKTATSYMQKKLALNVDLLARHGIHYDPLDVFRKNFTPLLNDETLRRNDFVRDTVARAKTAAILVSEENIMGVPGDLVREGNYYARSQARLARTCDLLETDAPELLMSLREYSAFMVSMYGEYIRHREFLEFAEYLKIYEASGFGWMKVIDDIFAAAPGATLHLWDFANFRAVEKHVFRLMTGFDPETLEEPEGPVRESLSDVAMTALEALSKVLKHQDMKKLIKPIARNLPKGDGRAGFDPLGTETKDRMRAQYKTDLAAIAAKYPGINFIGA